MECSGLCLLLTVKPVQEDQWSSGLLGQVVFNDNENKHDFFKDCFS